MIHGVAFARIIAYVEEICHLDQTKSPVFVMNELVSLYEDYLHSNYIFSPVHSSRLKERILNHLPYLVEARKGKNVLLLIKDDLGLAINAAFKNNIYSNAVCLARAAEIIRTDLFSHASEFCFEGSFPEGCQENSVPQSLLALIQMLLEGPSIIKEQDRQCSQEALSIAQLVKFNTIVHARTSSHNSTSTFHRKRRESETPLPLYIATLIHSKTRDKELIQSLHNVGLSVSYNRFMQVSSELGNTITKHYNDTGIVCPPALRRSLFTTGAVDNIDHNTSSNTSQNSFHGTGISLIQHPCSENMGKAQTPLKISPDHGKGIQPLPTNYSIVPPVYARKEPAVPPASFALDSKNKTHFDYKRREELEWLDHVENLVQSSNDITAKDQVNWSAFHAQKCTENSSGDPVMKCVNAMLPLFHYPANSAAMIKHSMQVVKDVTEHLNPTQIPVIECDQPLFALAKQIQWTWTEFFGEGKFVVMFGGLHIEMEGLKILGKLVKGMDWVTALEQAGVFTKGVADSLLKASHVKKTRYAHQVTAATLHILRKRAFQESGCTETFESWTKSMEESSPSFLFWSLVLNQEITVLQFIHALRVGDFRLYVSSLEALAPWCFALDFYNYARWLTVHIRDMLTLEEKCPSVYREFMKGKFVAHKSGRPFSAMALDQMHEQENAVVKGEGGCIGILDDHKALRRWMVTGPEMARLVGEFEENIFSKSRLEASGNTHHEASLVRQQAFLSDVCNFMEVVDEYGNPFSEQSEDLLTLVSKEILSKEVVTSVKGLVSLGHEQYHQFMSDRLQESPCPTIYDRIVKNNVCLSLKKVKPRSTSKLERVQRTSALFQKLYISCQHRETNMERFFSHENFSFPPSLSMEDGSMRKPKKSDMLDIFEVLFEPSSMPPQVSAILLDGSVIVNFVRPDGASNFHEYATKKFVPYLQSQLVHDVQRVDVVWDEYRPDSLKKSCRLGRGKGTRQRVQSNNKPPKNWQDFLRVDENKTELYAFLAKSLMDVDWGDKVVVTTLGENVIASNEDLVLDDISPCTHEEADTRLFVHAAHLGKAGHDVVSIRTVDTDVVVLAVATYHQLRIAQLWIAFGQGKTFKYLPIHDIATKLDLDK